MVHDAPLDQVLSRLLFSHDNVAKSTTGSDLNGRAVLFGLFDSEKRRKFSKDRLSLELLVRALVVECDEILDVVVSIKVEIAVHLLLFLFDFFLLP